MNTILIAEDEPVSRRILEVILKNWGFSVVVTRNGGEAWQMLTVEKAPQLAILDWMMPEMDGVDICRRVRERKTATPPYLILLTTRDRSEDIVEGLRAGADDYVCKPYDHEELRARVNVGLRVSGLQRELADHVHELEQAIAQVKQLQGLLPICSYCKKIRDDHNYWQQVEQYVGEHSSAKFTHSVCPECYSKHVQPQLEQIRKERK